MYLLIYSPHWLYEIVEDYVLFVNRFMIHVLMEINIVGVKFKSLGQRSTETTIFFSSSSSSFS